MKPWQSQEVYEDHLHNRENGNNTSNGSRKFIGGAERARRQARNPKRQQYTSASNQYANNYNYNTSRRHGNGYNNGNGIDQKRQRTMVLPKSLKPSERFFASLCLSSVQDFIQSGKSVPFRDLLLSSICGRLGIGTPSAIPSSNQSPAEYFQTRASLVMEESRAVLADELQKQQRRRSSATIPVQLVDSKESSKSTHVVLTFEPTNSSHKFSSKELYNMRPGSVFRIHVPADSHSDSDDDSASSSSSSSSMLSCVVPKSPRGDDSDTYQLDLMIFPTNTMPSLQNPHDWKIEHVATLVSYVRQFEACQKAVKVAFLPSLLVEKQSIHTRFYSDSEEEIVQEDSDEQAATDCSIIPALPSCSVNIATCFALPKLNKTQHKAMTNFIKSPDSTLSLVQGPPGTGKTTFLVSVLANLLIHDANSDSSGSYYQRRILVTAPTNKAVAVLATRFLKCMNKDAPISIVLIGVEEKLVESDDDARLGANKNSDSLRRIFAYTWMKTLQEDYEMLKKNCSDKAAAKKHAIRLHERVKIAIPYEAKASGLDVATGNLVLLLNEEEETISNTLKAAFEEIEKCAKNINPSSVTMDLLNNASIIFCTLSTAGASVMKNATRVDDLLVDEAAAATEPEMCIPLHMRPTRMLAVGDPMQLPALVVSKYASSLGLSKSLHQRLMMDCDADHIMLDTQYRMKPAISSFPSGRFYKGKLSNGNIVQTPSYRSKIGISLLKGAPYTFLQCDGEESQEFGGSYSNVKEAKRVTELVKQIRLASTSKSSAKANNFHEPWYSPNRLRIITFYQGQVTSISRMLLKAGLKNVLVTTVDSSQGCEADIVIVSFVRSNKGPAGNVRRCAGFLDDPRRINVAITRARHQLVCVGNAHGTLRNSGSDTLKAMIDDAVQREVIC